MQAPTEQALDQFANEALRREVTVTELTMRIARLAIALGLKLDEEQDVHRVLHHASPSTPAGEHLERVVHLRSRAWTELRGLLVLRYEMERHLVEDMGLQLSRRILEDAELHLTIAGFKPGVDGLSLEIHHLFGDLIQPDTTSPAP
jgi:hypothetical protein